MAPLSTNYATRRYVFGLFAWVIVVVLVIGYWQWRDVRHQAEVARADDIQLCQESATNREAIRDSLKRGFSNLGYRWDEKTQEPVFTGPPALRYYRDNPGEITTQLERLRQELDGFPPIKCPEEG